MVKLKTDPKLPHHYIIGVAMRGLKSKNPGELYLKYGPLYFSNKEVEDLRDAIMLSTDKLFPTTNKEALDITKSRSLVHNISSMRMAARANTVTLHHFASSFKLEDEGHFEALVKQANKNESIKKKFMEAII